MFHSKLLFCQKDTHELQCVVFRPGHSKKNCNPAPAPEEYPPPLAVRSRSRCGIIVVVIVSGARRGERRWWRASDDDDAAFAQWKWPWRLGGAEAWKETPPRENGGGGGGGGGAGAGVVVTTMTTTTTTQRRRNDDDDDEDDGTVFWSHCNIFGPIRRTEN